MMEKWSILAIADTHIGSRFSLWPPNFIGKAGQKYPQNKAQKRLYRYWLNLSKSANDFGIEELWVVGDVIQGLNYKERGRFLVVSDLDDQINAAVLAIRDFLKELPDVKVRIWSGTMYHESVDFRVHMRLAEKLSEYGFYSEFQGGYSFIKLPYTEKYAFVTHHASAAVIYPHTPMQRDIRWFKVRMAEGKLPPVKIIIRAHKHMFDLVDDKPIHAFQLPCFTLFQPYDRALKMYPMYQTDIGGLFITMREDGRMKYQEWLYPPFLYSEEGKIMDLSYDKTSYVEGW